MNFGELADTLTTTAKSYRNGILLKEIAPRLAGKLLSRDTVRQVLEPFVEQLMPKLPEDVQRMIKRRLEEHTKSAALIMRTNAHMHNADNSGLMSQNNADAILVDFVNFACVPLDLGFYAKDLLPGSDPTD
jgi:hypothetical protein